MNKIGLIGLGMLVLLVGAGIGFVGAYIARPFGGGTGEAASLRSELDDVRAELRRENEAAEAARTELAKSRADVDLKFAGQVAELFLNSVGEGGDEGPALAVCTKECRARQMGFVGYMTFVPDRVGQLKWSITSHQPSAAHDRVAYSGTLTAIHSSNPWRRREFQLMMVKENGGDWKVSAFTLQARIEP